MALGKAFIEVHADTKPFARELGRELGAILATVERTPARKIGEKFGDKVTEGIGDSVKKNKGRIGKSIGNAFEDATKGNEGAFTKFGKSIIDSIDDGLSGLPGEVKAALGAILIAIAPALAASLTGLITAGLIGAFAGLGVLIASQFLVVQNAWAAFLVDAKQRFQTLGGVFVLPVLQALDLVKQAFIELQPAIADLFATASTFIVPFTEALIQFARRVIPYLQTSLENVSNFLPELIDSFDTLAIAVGKTLEIITGADDAGRGLEFLAVAAGALLVEIALLVRGLTELFGVMYDIVQLVNDPAAFALRKVLDDNKEGTDQWAEANKTIAKQMGYTIARTDAETKAIKLQEKAIKAVSDALRQYVDDTFAAWQGNIDFEQGLDDMTETLKKHRGALNIDTQAGRDNQRAIMNAAQALINQRQRTIDLTGDVEAANRTFQTNKKRLEDAAVAAGISRKRFEELTGAVLAIPPAKDTGITQVALDRAGRALGVFRAISGVLTNAILGGALFAAGRLPAYADGGLITSPTVGLMGEAGPEAVIPLNNPARAAQLLNQSGLSAMLSPTVVVYIGNRQIDGYIDNRQASGNRATARDLRYGTRAA